MAGCLRMLICLGMLLGGVSTALADAGAGSAVVARVNGKPIKADQLQLQFFLDQLPTDASPEARQQLVEKLIDRELIRQYLQTRKVAASAAQLDHQQAVLQQLIATRGEELHDVLNQLHLTPESVREVLALPLAWETYVQSVVTEAQIRAEWNAHRQELDGTRVQASQIVRIVKSTEDEEAWQTAEKLLKELRQKILAGEITFAAAAESNSQSPSGKKGGELGEFEFRGRVDDAISQVAFSTPPGQISEPFRTQYGVHLVQTQSLIPGQLSLEDVRAQLLSRLGKELWDQQVAASRKKAKIQLVDQESKGK